MTEHSDVPTFRPSDPPLKHLSVEFVGSFPDPGVQLTPPLPEIAFVGRSNVGKSSLLNALTGRAGLARVSSTPGKTAHVNVFRFPGFYLVDLPGYGFARASKSAREGYRRLVDGYLRKRERLAGVVWLLDIRHLPSKDDQAMQQLLIEAGTPILAVFTKADKLGREAQSAQSRALARALGLDQDHTQLVSSTSGQGIAELGASILAATGRENG
ncbi:MAG TPA: ribosome biogenesis GTP-binding protein YihA/YsxC [Gemmatimonadales bacterium]|nr:ribosome biogenesis GTP-binding protein YihA/YsxC [Gemmatimonadales bacterium]